MIRKILNIMIAFLFWFSTLTPIPLVQADFTANPNGSNFGNGTFRGSITTAQDFQTDLFTGTGTTSFNIEVPAGRRNIAPSLKLTYASNSGNSWVGAGWNFELGYIQRRADDLGILDYGANQFLLYLNDTAAKLIHIGGSQYAFENEGPFLKIEQLGNAWKVTDKNGTQYFFGTNIGSQMENTNGIYRWYLEKVKDTNANTMLVDYDHLNGQTYLKQIRYTGNEITGSTPLYTVDFVLEDRPDKFVSYQSYSRFVIDKRLKEIVIKSQTTQFRRYLFEYQISPDSFRSLLYQVTIFGKDDTTSLPPVRYIYRHNTNQAQNPMSWGNVPTQYNSGDGILNLRYITTGEFDHSGKTDLALSYAGISQITSPDTPSGRLLVFFNYVRLLTTTDISFQDRGIWLTCAIPGASMFLSSVSATDANSDGYDDIISNYTQGTGASIRLGQSFNTAIGLTSTANFFYNGLGAWENFDFPLRINGDSIPDFASYKNNFVGIKSQAGSYAPVNGISLNLNSIGKPVVGDFNGDGFDDVAVNDDGDWKVKFSNGIEYVDQETWLIGFGAGATSLAGDFNNDGLADIAYVSGGAWHVAVSDGSKFNITNDFLTNFDVGGLNAALGGDFNGDGLMDVGRLNISSGGIEVALASQGIPSDKLIKIENGLGGSTEINYQAITPIFNLRFPIQAVKEVTQKDGMGNSYTTSYEYMDGIYSDVKREFRGFGRVKVIDPTGNYAIHYFHQGDNDKGKLFKKETFDSSNNLFVVEESIWEGILPYPTINEVHFTRLNERTTQIYDGNTTSVKIKARFDYDQYGNILHAYEDGDITVTGDEHVTENQYTYDVANYIVNKPQQIRLNDTLGNRVSEKNFVYDSRGNLETESAWNDQGPDIVTTMTYDDYGNLLTVQDPRGAVTTNEYDPVFHQYPIRITNYLGHVQEFTYDTVLGQVTESKDQNGTVTKTIYDALGRHIKVISPLDSEAAPTKQIEYDLSVFPHQIITRTKSSAYDAPTPEYFVTYSFRDGLGREIQRRSPAEDPTKQIVSASVVFNSRGLVESEFVPYFDDASTSYRSTDPSVPKTSFEYDALGRETKTIYPDGSFSSLQFNDFEKVVTNQKGKQTKYVNDAYGHLSFVTEFNGTETYTTSYEYDARGLLLKTRDALGNETTITYSSLGRKIGMHDPNLGTWSYEYDPNGNVTTQIDAKNQRVEFSYDLLNRLTEKRYPDGRKISYFYDLGLSGWDAGRSIGRLVRVADLSGQHQFRYDALGRVIVDKREMDGQGFTFSRVYDALGRVRDLTYPDQQVIEYRHNLMGEVETISQFNPSDSQRYSIITNVGYNPSAQIVLIQYGNGVVSDYTYDPLTLRLSHLVTSHPQLDRIYQDLTYVFDSVGNVQSIQDAIHTNSQMFQYDDLDRLIQASGSYGTQDYHYDAIGNLLQKGQKNLTYNDPLHVHGVTQFNDPVLGVDINCVYDANGNMIQKGNLSLAYDYDNRLVKTKEQDGGEEPTDSSYTFQFNPGWNFFSLPFIPDGSSSISEVFGDVIFGIDYDQISRWNGMTQQWEHFVNDMEFNDFVTLEVGRGYQIYVTNPNGISVTINGSIPEGDLEFSYGSGWHFVSGLPYSGNTSIDGVVTSGSYNSLVQYNSDLDQFENSTSLVQGKAYFLEVTESVSLTFPNRAPPTARYSYDASGNRSKKIFSGHSVYYLGKDFESRELSQIKYIFLGDQRIASIDSEEGVKFYHQDHLGSTNVVTDVQGNETAYYEYEPWGETAVNTGYSGVAHKFTSQEEDEEFGFYYYVGRYYDPVIGRFLTADPTVQHPTDPQDLNRYAYARNNPIVFTDPTGFGFFSKLFGFIFGLIGAAVGFVVSGFNPAGAVAGFKIGFAIGSIVGTVTDIALLRFGRAFLNPGGFGAASAGIDAGAVGVEGAIPILISGPSPGILTHIASAVAQGMHLAATSAIKIAPYVALAFSSKNAYAAEDSDVSRTLRVFSRPLQTEPGRSLGGRHEIAVDDQGYSYELENQNGLMQVLELTQQETRDYFKKWEGQLKGPLYVKVDNRLSSQMFRYLDVTRSGNRYRWDRDNSNAFIRTWIRLSNGRALDDRSLGCVPGGSDEISKYC